MYRMKCLGCAENDQREGMYIGETARSIGERASEHLVKYEQNEKNSVFHKHMIEWHGSIPQDINIDILAMCPGDVMLRQVTEAVSINELNPTLNAKEEWGNSNKLRERRNLFEFMDLANLSLTNSARTQRSAKSNILTEEAAEGR